jgi:hypothetical protein
MKWGFIPQQAKQDGKGETGFRNGVEEVEKRSISEKAHEIRVFSLSEHLVSRDYGK